MHLVLPEMQLSCLFSPISRLMRRGTHWIEPQAYRPQGFNAFPSHVPGESVEDLKITEELPRIFLNHLENVGEGLISGC